MPSELRSPWERLGDQLVRRRIELDSRYRNRRVFIDERLPGQYRTVNKIERGHPGNYEDATYTMLEVGYELAPGTIRRALDGAPLEPAAIAERLESGGRRPDAAAVLREVSPPAGSSGRGTPALIAALLAKPGMDDYLAEIDAERADGGFVARDKYEVAIWTDPLLHEDDKRAIIAYGRLMLAEGVQMGRQADSTVGLSQYTGL